jgi:hypothetical protein
MKVVVLVGFNPMGCEYRQRNWEHVRHWIVQHHPDWYIISSSPPPDENGFFPCALARNMAANLAWRIAHDWDCAVFWDADTVTHPEAVREAVARATGTEKMVLACDSHMYMDQPSTDRVHNTGLWLPKPRSYDSTQPFDKTGIYRRPCSGVYAVSRELWRATGGFISALDGSDSHEDLCFFQQCNIFGNGVEWVEGMQLHLWHPPANRQRGRNYQVWQHLARVRHYQNAKQVARDYLWKEFQHVVPE